MSTYVIRSGLEYIGYDVIKCDTEVPAKREIKIAKFININDAVNFVMAKTNEESRAVHLRLMEMQNEAASLAQQIGMSPPAMPVVDNSAVPEDRKAEAAKTLIDILAADTDSADTIINAIDWDKAYELANALSNEDLRAAAINEIEVERMSAENGAIQLHKRPPYNQVVHQGIDE